MELRKFAQRGFLTRAGRGLYRFGALPATPLDHYMEAVLWVGADAVLSHDAVLALHDLAFANPRRLRVTTPHRVRKARHRPDVEIVIAPVPAEQRTRYEGIPSTTVARALIDSRHLIMASRLREAADDARARGLLLVGEHQRVLAALNAPTPPHASNGAAQ